MESNTNAAEHGKSTSTNDADDVPGDFFDDFLKDDFMAGLDIVDEAGEDDEHPFPLVDSNLTLNRADSKDSPKKLPPSNGSDAKPTVTSAPNEQKDKEVPKPAPPDQKSAKSRLLTDRLGPKAHARPIRVLANRRLDGDEPRKDRRDPKKTFRDIERDKVKCEKDKEKKIINEKLMVVETGLVPPGLEMEFEMDNRQSDSVDRTRGASPPRRQSKHRYSSERLRKRSFSPRRNRGRSPPPRRSPLQRGGGGRRRSPPEPRYKRSRYSPGRRRSRSYSPVARPKKREEKKSFLEELAEKLNEMRPVAMPPATLYPPQVAYAPPPQHQMTNMMPPVRVPYYPNKTYIPPVPAPVPAPPPVAPVPQFMPRAQHPEPYDRSYFIGEATNPFLGPPPQQQQQQGSQQQMLYNATPEAQPLTMATFTPVVEKKPEKETTSDAAVQLFHDKKISLSQFLSTTVKEAENSSTPVDLRERVKVISRCQDAIKYLDFVEKRFSGCLVIYKDQTSVERHKSPLMRASRCAIPYTEPTRSGSARPEPFSGYIDRLLRALGLVEKPVVVPKQTEDPVPPPAPSITGSVVTSQHDECQSCAERKKRTFKSSTTQCDGTLTFSVGTQVSDEDFRPKLKNQSLASLTPAQLLSEMGQGSKFKNDFESGFKAGQRKPYQQQPQYGTGQGRSYNPFLD